jgi:competence protein ComEC
MGATAYIKYPVWFMAAGIGLGIAMAYGVPWLPRWVWFLSAGSGFVGWYLIGDRQRFFKPIGLALIVISLGGQRGHQAQAQEQESLLAWGDRRTIAFTGTIATQPRKQYESMVFCLRVKHAEYLGKSYPVLGRLWCRGPLRSDLPLGLLVTVSGSLTQTSYRSADGGWQSVSRLRGWDLGWIKSTECWSNQVLLASARMHCWMNSWLTRNCAPEQAPLLQALVCGDRDNLDPAFYQACCRAGLAHAIALSGTNLTFVVLLWVGLTWLLPVTIRAPIRWIGATLLGLCYLACTEWPVSLARAWVMLAVTALVCMAQRTPDLLTSLGWAALILIFQNPRELFNPGYQLSVLATASLARLSHLAHCDPRKAL